MLIQECRPEIANDTPLQDKKESSHIATQHMIPIRAVLEGKDEWAVNDEFMLDERRYHRGRLLSVMRSDTSNI